MFRIAIIVVLCVAGEAAVAQNAPFDLESDYSELVKQSEVVLLGKCKSVRAVARDSVALKGVPQEDLRLFDVSLAEVTVAAVLKGANLKVNDVVRVPVLAYSENVLVLKKETELGRLATSIKFPEFVRVEGKPTLYSPSGEVQEIKPVYLLFLNRQENGVYEPASGHLHSAHSIRMIGTP